MVGARASRTTALPKDGIMFVMYEWSFWNGSLGTRSADQVGRASKVLVESARYRYHTTTKYEEILMLPLDAVASTAS